MNVVFINCRRHPFLDMFMREQDRKTHETRTRNTLRALIGQRVFFAETGHGRRPLCRCSGVIGEPLVIRSREDWDRARSLHQIPPGSPYDWQPGTKVKYLYPIIDVHPVPPFTPPEGIRHGRVWMECTN